MLFVPIRVINRGRANMRISGITIPENKRLEVALTTIFGIGESHSRDILNTAKVSFDAKTKDLTSAEEGKIRELIEGYSTEGDLKRKISGNVKRLKDIKSYRGMRHSRNLPCRGQRTKTNSRTVRGNLRKTMGSGKRKLEKK